MKQPACYYSYWRRYATCIFAENGMDVIYTKEWVLRRVAVYRFDWTWRDLQSRGEYRQGTSYRRNPEHQKKEASDEVANKTIWRDSRKDWRHHHKCRYGHSCKRGGTARGWCLKTSRRCERRWVKQMIYRERYEDIPLKDGTMFYEPWAWN